MDQLQFTQNTKILFLLSLLLFLIGYLFANLLPALSGTLILIFLIYTKQNFKQNIGEIIIDRKIIEKLRFVNQPTNIKTTVQHTGGYLKIKATDVLPANTTLLKGDNTVEQFIKPGEIITLDYQIRFTNRGNHTFDNVELEFTDRWNLYTQKITQSQKKRITVHSDPNEIKKAKRISTREHIEITLPSLVGTETLYEMEGIREYTPGDILRDIEWKATSRLQKLMTKMFQKKEMVETMILLDCSRSMRRATGKTSKLEHATVLAIHLTKILQSLRHPVGLIAYDEFKTLNTINPTNNHTIIFEELANLPGIIKTNAYKTKKHPEILENKQEDIQEKQQFLTTVYPFLARGKRTITIPSQASGIYEAIRILLLDNQSKHLIILTDMETNIQSLYSSIGILHAKKFKIWLLPFFTPFYHLEKKHLTSEELEKLYKLHDSREKMLMKLKRRNIEIVELTPLMEGGKIIETIRRK